MSDLFRFSGAVRHHPDVEEWLSGEPWELCALARHQFRSAKIENQAPRPASPQCGCSAPSARDSPPDESLTIRASLVRQVASAGLPLCTGRGPGGSPAGRCASRRHRRQSLRLPPPPHGAGAAGSAPLTGSRRAPGGLARPGATRKPDGYVRLKTPSVAMRFCSSCSTRSKRSPKRSQSAVR